MKAYRRLSRFERRIQWLRAWLHGLAPRDEDIWLLILAGGMIWLLWVVALGA